MEAAAADLMELMWEQGKLPSVPRARDISEQVIGAMHYLHNCNTVHQDLEHEDVLLTTDGYQAKLSDFGLSKETNSYSNLSTMFCRTAAYVSPKLLMGIPLQCQEVRHADPGGDTSCDDDLHAL